MQQLNAIRVIQRNGRALMKIRNWSWWRLFTKIKPLLQVARQDEELAQKQDEIRRLKTELDSRTVQIQETEQKLQQVHEDRDALNERLIHSNEVLVESDEVNRMISCKDLLFKHGFLSRLFVEYKHVNKNLKIFYKIWNNAYKKHQINIIVGKLTEKSSIRKYAIYQNSKVLFECLRKNSFDSLLFRLEEEEQMRQKLQVERTQLEGKIKDLENVGASQQNELERVQKERKLVDEKLQESGNQRQDDEEKLKNLLRIKTKLEGQVSDLEERLKRETEVCTFEYLFL